MRQASNELIYFQGMWPMHPLPLSQETADVTLDKLIKTYLFARTLTIDNPSLKMLFWGVHKKHMNL